MMTISAPNWINQKSRWLGRFIYLKFNSMQPPLFFLESEYLLSMWYDYALFRARKPRGDVYEFLDRRVKLLKRRKASLSFRPRRRVFATGLLEAFQNERLRVVIIKFLESRTPYGNYGQLQEAINQIWRNKGQMQYLSAVPEIAMVGAESVPPVAKPVDSPEVLSVEPCVDLQRISARAYYIAAELHFELSGNEAEFAKISRNVPRLRKYVCEQFGVKALPGRFDDLNGYSYKIALTDKNTARRGQLQPTFRQIVDHPEVFGLAVSGRAQVILDKNFI